MWSGNPQHRKRSDQMLTQVWLIASLCSLSLAPPAFCLLPSVFEMSEKGLQMWIYRKQIHAHVVHNTHFKPLLEFPSVGGIAAPGSMRL